VLRKHRYLPITIGVVNVRILIIEDEALVALSHAMVAMEAGHVVTGTAWNTFTALNAVNDQKPDIALVDMRLSDGLSGNKIALTLYRDYGIKPVIVTANVNQVDPDVFKFSLSILPKPIGSSALHLALDAASDLLNAQSH
jgi:DNA-binding NtrC family response regulator